jgi:uncharacterized membrane protein
MHLKLSFITAILTLTVPAMAAAGLEICNETGSKLSIAVGYKSGGQWVSEGWWNIENYGCQTPVSGDLQNRYYYYHASSPDIDLEHEKIPFCVDSDLFSIEGDQDCSARGFRKEMFTQIDTGESARDFVLTLTGTLAPSGQQTETPDAITPPGTHGEPYSAGPAILQECIFETSIPFCAFHAYGYKLFVYDDGRTPQSVFDNLSSLDSGDPISAHGDLVSYYDRTAEVVLREAGPRPWTQTDRMLRVLYGNWYSVDDPASTFLVVGAERHQSYNDTFMHTEYIAIQEWCDDYADGGNYLYVLHEVSGEHSCYGINHLSDQDLELTYLPRGNTLHYRRLN